MTDLLDAVMDRYDRYNFDAFTARDVGRGSRKRELGRRAVRSAPVPAAAPFLEQMARKAQHLTTRQFGNSVGLYTPLYIANYCVNHCVYCGFNCQNHINRGKLTFEEIDHELAAIAKTGLREILLLTGESRYHSDVEYIGKAVEIAKQYFTTIGIEVYPMEVEEYAHLQRCGADFVSVYQETYDREKYAQVHLSGPKRGDFAYRFNAQERALMAACAEWAWVPF